MVEFRRVSFSRGTREILRDVSFSIQQSERVAILGRSGEGKTTLLLLILGLISPDDGQVLIEGRDIAQMSQGELQEMRLRFGVVFQQGALFDSLTVRENVAFHLRENLKLGDEEVERRVRELLDKVSVEHAIDMMPEELSGGMQRRVSIARALVEEQSAMFLYDEPTGGLDPIVSGNIRKLILELADEGRGFVIVTHSVIDAMKTARRFMFIKDGRIVFDGNSDELAHSSEPVVQAFVREGKI